MRTLFLMRHAHAEHRNNSDIERRLDIHGEREAETVGKKLLNASVIPQRILSSPAIRAYATALIVAEVLTGTTRSVLIENSIYKNDEEDLLELVQRQEDTTDSLLMVGHNPSISALASQLSSEMDVAMPTAGVAVLRFNCSRWADVSKKQGVLLLFESPAS